jgi:hypothetical protein
MKAKYISGSGAEGTAAVIEVNGEQYECMDCLGYGRGRGYRPGDVVSVRFVAGNIRTGPNAGHVKALESLGGWRYRASGVVVVNGADAVLDCGTIEVELSDQVDSAMHGEYVTVEIDRMDCWRSSRDTDTQRPRSSRRGS